jgi:hypothetical protein
METENMMQVNPYAQIMGTQESAAQAPAPAQYAAMQNPTPPEVQQMHQPTQNPVEIQQRQEGWKAVIQKISSDPNLMRAIGMFGGSLASARTPGQTHGGHFGQAMMVGQGAYDFGKQAEIDQRMRMTKEQREQTESDARVASTQAQTEGQVLTNTKTRATMDDAISKVKTEREKAEVELAGAKDENEKRRIELAYQKKVDGIRQGISDTAIRASLDEELKTNGLRNRLLVDQSVSARASANASNASAGNSAASARLTNQKASAIEELSGEDKRDYLLQRGKYGLGAGSAQVQVNEYFRTHWTNSNPKKENETDEAYKARQSTAVLKHMATVRDKGDAEQFLKFIEVQPGPMDETPDQMAKRFTAWKATMASISGGGSPGATATGAQPGTPAVGEVVNGRPFLGGDPSKPTSWGPRK